MTLSFSEHVELLELHGRAAVDCLAQLSPEDATLPGGESARQAALEHWATLEIWARTLQNPTVHWSQRARPEAPADYRALVAAIETELRELSRSFDSAGPEVAIDYFGRPGTSAEVARLLAHEAIVVAHRASVAAGHPTMVLHPLVASDGLDQALGHWVSPDASLGGRTDTVAVRATDTKDAWYLSVTRATRDSDEGFRLIEPTRSAVVVEGLSSDLLWWLHGHTVPEGTVKLDGDADVIRLLRSVLLHPVAEAPKRRRWLFKSSR